MVKLSACLAALLPALALAPPSRAQCEPEWQAFDKSTSGFPGTNGIVSATTVWDPDGGGPETPKVIVAGAFTIAGNTLANNIAMHDPDSGYWTPLGSGITGISYLGVRALAVLPSGDLVAGGAFNTAGGLPASNIARWSATAKEWSPIGLGLDSTVCSIVALPSGDLVVGGAFSKAGGMNASAIARWNGSAWLPLGTGMAGGYGPTVFALAVLASGDIVAAGEFTSAGGVSALRIASWDGAKWTPLGSGMSHSVYAVAALPSGELVAGGVNSPNIFRWNGATWSPLGTQIKEPGYPDSPAVFALTVLPTGDLVAGGSFLKYPAPFAKNIARWDGTSWIGFGSGLAGLGETSVRSITALPSGELIAGGQFGGASGKTVSNIARWNGASWSAMSTSLSGASGAVVNAFARLPTGEFVMGGWFDTVGTLKAKNIAQWNGSAWSQIGSGLSDSVSSLLVLPTGDLVAGGYFKVAGTNSIARWNGSTWSPLGSGMGVVNPWVYALAMLPSGDLVAGGHFTTAGGLSANRIARWDGSAWLPLGLGVSGMYTANVHALAVLHSGDLIAGGEFADAGGVSAANIARWNGADWSPLGSGVSGGTSRVHALAVLPSGDLIVGGVFATAGGVSASCVARWDGAAWAALGLGTYGEVEALTRLPSGDLIAGGYFTAAGGQPANYIARWDGTSWSSIGSGMDASIRALATLPSGDIVAGGWFTTAGNAVAPRLARFACPSMTCYPDCDASGSLTLDDFICFQTLYALNNTAADCDQSGTLDIDDFICFQTAYALGC